MVIISLEISFIILLILLNGVFSMSEIAVLTSKKHTLKSDANKGSRRAKIVLDLADHPEKFMSSVQVGITLIGILTGVFSGATLSEALASIIAGYDISDEIAELIAMLATVSVITYFTLIFGELLPKKIALASPNTSAKSIAPFIKAIQFAAHPIVILISRNVIFFSKIMRLKEDKGTVTDEDVKSFIDEAKFHGAIEHEEKNILHRVMRFADIRVAAIMTHRSRIVHLNISDSTQLNAQILRNARHSTYPVSEGSPDNLVGFVNIKDLFGKELSNLNVKRMLQQPLFVHESSSAMSLLNMLKETGKKMAFVIDEYGEIQGIATPTNILESLVGGIKDHPDSRSEIILRDDGSILVDAHAALHDVFEKLAIDTHLESEYSDINTISGFIFHHLKDIPKESDSFIFRNFKFEVIDMDGHKLDKILVSTIDHDSAAHHHRGNGDAE